MELRLVILHTQRGQTSHCVCVVNGYIFDANGTNALPFCKDALDDCCGEGDAFAGIKSGFYFAFLGKGKSKQSFKLKRKAEILARKENKDKRMKVKEGDPENVDPC